MANVIDRHDVLAGLDEVGQRQLYDALALKFETSTLDRAAQFDRNATATWQALCKACALTVPNDAVANRALNNLCRKFGRAKYLARVQELEAFIDFAADGEPLSRAARDALRVTILECLADKMAGWRDAAGYPRVVQPRSMLNAFDHIRSAVERNFPGYTDAGLLGKILINTRRAA